MIVGLEDTQRVSVTGRRLASIVYWKGMWIMVREYVRNCITCQQNKYETVALLGTLQPLPQPKGLFIDITMDIGGSAKISRKNCDNGGSR